MPYAEVLTTSETQTEPVVLGVDHDAPMYGTVRLYRLGHWMADMTPDEADELALALIGAAAETRAEMAGARS